MQNVVNYLCPFFRNGSPIVDGRVYFVKPSTSALTFSDVEGLDSADFIAIKDKDGTLLENPLSLDSEGRFSVQPFVDDGTDFKMIVCYPTGVPAEINDQSMTYGVAYTINSFAQEAEILSIGGVATVDSVADLRNLEPTVKAALVRGFGAAGDFCPPRIFNWVTTAFTDNNGTKIRSSVQGYTTNGTWVCTPSGFVDVRWFGVNPEGSADCTSILLSMAQDFPGIPLYFPAGSYFISSHVTAKSVILERLAIIYPTDAAANDIRFTVENSFDNRGGRFEKNGRDCCVFPKVRGTLRTSWLSAPMDAALASASIENVDEIIFDATKSVSVAVTIAKKRILVKDGVTVNNAVTFDPTCSVYLETDGSLSAGSMKLGNGWSAVPDDSATPPELKLSKGGSLIARIKEAVVELLVKVKMALGFLIDGNNAWQVYDNAQSDWNGLLVLVAERIFATDVRTNNANAKNLIAENVDVMNGAVNRYLRYSDDFFAQVGNGAIHFWGDYPAASQAYTNDEIKMYNIYDFFDNVEGDGLPRIITVMIDEHGSTKMLLFPNDVLDGCAFVVYNPLKNPLSLFEVDRNDPGTVLGIVKVLGLFKGPDGIATSENIPTRLYVRNPSDAERTRYHIPDTAHWIIDPFAM